MNRNANQQSAHEKSTKFCQSRVQHVEKNFGLICETLGSITRKNARLRNKGDVLAGHVKNYADSERLNTTTRQSLSEFAQNFSAIQDYKQAEVTRLEAKVLRPLMQYGPVCKQMKATIKREMAAIKKERQMKQKLDKVREKAPGDRMQISKAETEVQRAAQDASLYSRALENEMEKFEKEKVTDLKKVLTEFLTIEMAYHGKALEYLSKCFENVTMIDEFSDVEEFSAALMDTTGSVRDVTMTPGGTLQDTYASTTLPSMSSTLTDRKQTVRISTSMYDDDDDDDDDYEDDDDEDDDDPPTTARSNQRVRYA